MTKTFNLRRGGVVRRIFWGMGVAVAPPRLSSSCGVRLGDGLLLLSLLLLLLLLVSRVTALMACATNDVSSSSMLSVVIVVCSLASSQ